MSLILLSIGIYGIYTFFYVASNPIIESVTLEEDDKIHIKYSLDSNNRKNKIYYIYKNENIIPDVNDKWILAKDKDIAIELDKNIYYVFLKNQNNKIFRVDNTSKLGKITSIEINKKKVYLAIKGTYSTTLSFDGIGAITNDVTWYSDDESIAKVDQNGKITGLKKGNTKVHAKVMDKDTSVDVVVTDLIIVRPKTYNSKKKYLPCGIYSKADNDLLDEILKDRINDAGYKTRAATVEAARFLALEFPYKIRYFSENGRGSTNGVDGEGRYYHVGLYLHSSRYEKIGKRSAGPKTWGCSLYSRPSHGYRPNGFDCSGFVSWVMLQGGFDVGDIGAGLAPHKDLTDFGVRTKFNYEVVKSGKVKVGDLLSSGGPQGGHIAIIVGEDDNYYYVAESLWTPPNVAVVIIAYSKKTLFNRYYYVMLMDSYYKSDGNLTKMWY